MKTRLLLILLFVFAGTGSTLNADTLLLDSIMDSPPNSPAGLIRPHRGMPMQDVKARFGEPVEIYNRVGEPPITRWVYPGYTVFFEFDRTITTVIHR